jgi:hypothetical protein
MAAIMASSLTGVRRVSGRPAFTRAAAVTLPASRGRFSCRRNTLALDDVDQDNIERISMQQYELTVTGTEGQGHGAVFIVCVP